MQSTKVETLAVLGDVETPCGQNTGRLSQNTARTHNSCATPSTRLRRRKLKGGQEGVDIDVGQFLRLVDLVRGLDCAVRVGGIQLEYQTAQEGVTFAS